MVGFKMLMVLALPAMASAAALAHSQEHIMSMPMYQYKDDCGKKSGLHVKPGAAAMLQVSTDNVPGAGIVPFDAFETVLKDGFMQTDCIKDYMYYRGDKFGDNKFDYKLGPVSNVSIVHYDLVVAKEDQHQMTQKVCFEFCRTVPNMGFFGIVNGRNCYCAPYFTPMASDSSNCDAVCEGEKTLMCGGKSKSSIFTMHMCASTEEDLNERSSAAGELQAQISTLAKHATGLGESLQHAGESLQSMFGQVGDSGASNLAQDAKEWAGTLEHLAEDADEIGDKLLGLVKEGAALKDFTDPATVTKAERIMEDIDETIAEGEQAASILEKQIHAAALPEDKVYEGAAKEYYPAMYFVDKEYDDVPSTCTGDVVEEPMVGSKDACASACDAHIHSCVGFQFFGGDETICTLLSSFKSGFYYTGCKSEEEPKKLPPLDFLQAKQPEELGPPPKELGPPPKEGGPAATCYAKLSKFEGTTLKPDGSGKCKQCFKDLTKADRCPW